MKKVLLRRKKYTVRDFLRLFGIIAAHYVAMFLYYGTILLLHWGIQGGKISFVHADIFQGVTWYIITIGPLVSALIHIYYLERGSSWMRGINWLHTMFMLIFFALAQFI